MSVGVQFGLGGGRICRSFLPGRDHAIQGSLEFVNLAIQTLRPVDVLDLGGEIQRVLVDNKGLAPANAQRFIDENCGTFPSGRIRTSTYESTASSWTGPDDADLLHLAAAACSGAAVLVTNNTKDFEPATPPPGVIKPTVMTADKFFCSLLDEGFDEDLVNVINAMISANRRPPQTWTAMMQRLATVGLSEFVDRLIEAAPRAT